MCLLRNIDSIKILLQGTVNDVESETKRIIEIGKQGGGYIFNSGEMVPRNVKTENIYTLMKTARKYSTY